jgi:integrase
LEPRPFTEAELKRLLTQVSISFPDTTKAARVTALIHLMVSTGLAIRDAVGLEKAAIADGRLRVKRQKTGKAISAVKLDATLLNELRAVLNGNPRYIFWEGRSASENMTGPWQIDIKRLMQDAGLYVQGNVNHRFRDTFVDTCLENGWSLTEVAAALGDTLTITEKHYASLAGKRMETRLDRLPARTW